MNNRELYPNLCGENVPLTKHEIRLVRRADKAAAWLRELIKAGLIPAGEVDERSITDVKPADLKGFTQCHFFAGIGGWSYALQLVRLRGYGNAIVPQVAAQFIQAYQDLNF